MSEKAIMTTSRIDHPVNLFFQKKVLTRVLAALLYQQFGQQDKIPQHAGDTSKWRRWITPIAQPTPVGEGVDNSPILIAKNDIEAMVKEYEIWTKISSWMKFTGRADDQQQIANILLDVMKLTIDTLCRNVLTSVGSQSTCATGAGTSTFLNKTDIDTVVNNMVAQNCAMVAGQIDAGMAQGTSPIRESYIAVGHTLLRPRLEAVSGFKHVSNYASQGPVYKDEFCSTGDVRWLLTTNSYYDGTYHHSMIFGKDFFGNVKIEGNSADKPLIFTPKDKVGSPGQRWCTLAAVWNYACKILNDHFGHDLLSTV